MARASRLLGSWFRSRSRVVGCTFACRSGRTVCGVRLTLGSCVWPGLVARPELGAAAASGFGGWGAGLAGGLASWLCELGPSYNHGRVRCSTPPTNLPSTGSTGRRNSGCGMQVSREITASGSALRRHRAARKQKECDEAEDECDGVDARTRR